VNIEWFRDLVVCIFGLGTVVAVIFFGGTGIHGLSAAYAGTGLVKGDY